MAQRVKQKDDRHSKSRARRTMICGEMYRTMVTSRLCDEAQFRLNRQGKAPFVVPVSGHEGCQVGTAWPMRPGQRHLRSPTTGTWPSASSPG